MAETSSVRTGPSPRAVLATVGFGVFVAADDLTVVSTMLRPIIGDLGLVLPDGLDDAAWIVNAYLIAYVAVMPIAGRLSDVIGRRLTFLGAYVLFLAGSIMIPLTSSLGPFLVGRVLTALGGGAMVPVALAVIGDVYSERSRARALGTLGAIDTFGWVWGPMYGAVLVRFLSWQWQFWLNIPLAVGGMIAVWWALADHDRPARTARVDWVGAGLLTAALVSLNLALLGSAEIQSVSGLDELTGSSGTDLRWLYPVALVAAISFVWHERRSDHPLVDRTVFRGRNVRAALVVNFVVGAALIIAMVDVPIFVNAVEVDVERSAVAAGWVLSALTAAMAVASYAGGRVTEATWYRPPVVLGMALTTSAYVTMGLSWGADTSYVVLALQLAVLGAGFGLVQAPTTSAVVDHAPADARGSAAAVVMVVRLLGLSVGLSALTAYGLARFNSLRRDIDLPPIVDPGFEDALRAAQATLTADAIAETFLMSAAVTAIGIVAALTMRRVHRPSDPDNGVTDLTDPAELPHHRGQTGEPMHSWMQRHLTAVLGAFVAVLAIALALIVLLFAQVSSARDDLDATRTDLERVEAGAALFASQVQGFQQQLVELEPTVSAGIDEAVAGLESFSSSTLEFDVAIDENVPINTEIVIDRTFTVPIRTSIPINESFETTIEVDAPFGLTVPVDVVVPVDIDVPVDLELTLPVNETIPVEANVPVQLDVPIRVDVAETQLAELADSLATGLQSFRDVLSGLGGD
ncbi:MAG: MFS transporter [Ilumatobacteraceae bacterium]